MTRLAEISTQALNPIISDGCLSGLPPEGGLRDLLAVRNGFYAFESALHVFPCGSEYGFFDIDSWNEPSLWKADYGAAAEGFTFFAEDIFGVQFGLRDGSVFIFDPETAESTVFARDCEDWARIILSEYNLRTGYSLAHAWQAAYGDLPVGYRLVPKVPFVVGGEFNISNLAPIESVASMKFRASIYSQIANLPDGTKVKLKFS